MTFSFSDLERISNNPSRVINEVLTRVENALGTDVAFNSPTHPFIVAMDMIVGQSSGLINQHLDAVSKLYPYHARDMDDLGRNMSNYQWYGMFANPSTTQMVYVLPTSEIERLAVEFTETSGTMVNTYRKLVIPKDTRIQVMSTYFMVETPIEIRLMDHGGHSVVYDSTKISPFNPISTNILTHEYVYINGERFLRTTIPVRQLNCTPLFNLSSTAAAGLKDTFAYQDNLYGISATITNKNGTTDLAIVYNGEVYDVTVPTLVISLDPKTNTFKYEIPLAYLNSGIGVGAVNLMVYTSKGYYEQDLKTIQTNDHTPEYLDYTFDNGSLDQYSAPIRNVSNQYWQTIQAVTGGKNPRTFDNVRQSIIYGSRRDSLPITPNQYSFNITDYGYTNVESTDFITNRLFKITKDLPLQTNKSFNSGIGCWVGDILYAIDDIVATGVVFDNGERVTIPARTLVSITDTGNTIIDKTTLSTINALPDDELIDYVKNNRLVFLPFHYIIDTTLNQVNVRPYILDNPVINYQRFLYENSALNIEVGIGSAQITYTPNGYLLTVSTTSGNDYKNLDDADVGVQFSYQPSGSNSLASMKGVLSGKTPAGERVWTFALNSSFDIDGSEFLHLSGLTQYGQTQDVNLTTLVNNFSLLFLKTGSAGYGVSASDLKIDRTLYSADYITIVEAILNIQFGNNMDGMYVRIRPLVGDQAYQVYDADVPAVYGTDIFQRDANKELVFGDDNLPILAHRATDIIMDVNGNPVIQYSKGTIKKDGNGNPIPLGTRKLKYHFSIIGFDASYYFSTDVNDSDYVTSIRTYLTDVVMKDLTAFTDRSLDETKIMYHPRMRVGKNTIVINEGVQSTLDLDFSFNITYYLTKNGMAQSDLQSAILTSTPGILNTALQNEVVSISALQTALSTMGGMEVVDVKIESFLGSTEIDVASRGDDSVSFSIRKILELTTEGIRSVKEDVNVDFKQHAIKNN